jgi:hypothetical protein
MSQLQQAPRRLSIFLWTVNLSSIAASIFSYVYLSYFVYQRTGSVLYSELVLLAPMFIPVLLCLVINRVAGASAPRQLLVMTNAAGMLVSLATYRWIDASVPAALLGALIIGFLDAIQRVARTVAVKRYFSAADVKYAVPLTLTAQFIAGGVAGVGLAFFKGEVTPDIASIIVTGAFAVAILAAWCLPRLTKTDSGAVAGAPEVRNRAGGFSAIIRLLKTNPPLYRHFMTYVVFVSTFQGFFNVSRVALPTHQLNLPQNFVGYLQIISAMSALAGALMFVWSGKRKIVLGRLLVSGLSITSLAAMIGATSVSNVVASYTMYFVFMFVWEFVFFKYQSDIVLVTAQEDMSLVATFQYAAVYLGMLITALIGGIVTHYFGLLPAAIAFSVAYLCFMVFTSFRRKAQLSAGCGM